MRTEGKKVLFYQPLAKEGTNTDSGTRLSESSRADFATRLLLDVRGPKVHWAAMPGARLLSRLGLWAAAAAMAKLPS